MKTSSRILWVFLLVGALGFAAQAARACVDYLARKGVTIAPVASDALR